MIIHSDHALAPRLHDGKPVVPPDSWDSPPWNRWSFRNIRKILPTAPVRRGSAPTWQLDYQIAPIEEIEFAGVSGDRLTVGDMLRRTLTDGFLVYLDGYVVHESYFNGMLPHSLHLLQSVSKSVTATVAAILMRQGLLDHEEKITTYLPELKQTAWCGATVLQVMDMTSGVAFDENYTDPNSDIARTDVACGWKPLPTGASSHADWPRSVWDQILSLRHQEVEHGKRFKYRSIETDVLAHAMERASDRSLGELVSIELWQKLGAEEDACFTVDRAGYSVADGGLNTTLRDLARFGILHLNGGSRGADQIIPPEFIDDLRLGKRGLFQPGENEHFPMGGYRSQFWIEDASRQTVMCLGVFGQMVFISPEYKMVAVKLSTWEDYEGELYT